MTTIEKIRVRLHEDGISRRPVLNALHAVLRLKPPGAGPGDSPTDHALLTEGWETCHHTVVLAVAYALGVTP